MSARICSRWSLVLLAVAAALGARPATIWAAQILVADRLSNSVYRYQDDGTFLGVVLTDHVTLNQPTGIAVSPDLTKLYISSFQNSRVVEYDYNAGDGTASNPTIFAEGFSDGLISPNAILFSQDGSKIYVSNLGGSGVAQFNANGTSAGTALNASFGEGAFFQFSGLAFAPTGELLVSAFQDFPAGTSGAVAKSDGAITALGNFVGPATSLNGASGLLVHGNDLYVASLFSGSIQRFDLATGAVEPGFNISGLGFPQALMAAPDGNGFLAGILGFSDGAGGISQYDFDGDLLGTFASPAPGRFTEATAFISIVLPFPGDANSDRVADFIDLGILLNNYNQAGTFSTGDFDYSGTVDFTDLGILLNNYNQQAPTSTPAAAVPEPSTLQLGFGGLLGLLLVARRITQSVCFGPPK